MKTTFTQIEVSGRSFAVTVDETGVFSSTIDGVDVDSTSLNSLRDKLREKVKRALTAKKVEATLYNEPSWRSDGGEPQFEDILLTGKNSHTRRLTYRGCDGQAGTVGYSELVLRRLTPEERAQFITLYTAQKAAQFAYEEYKHSCQIDGLKELQKALGVDEDD